ncbi:MAG: amidohydrolase [Nitrososphaerota archaeon]|nr:amidohydrolase [Nitrososphaerota archaeon]MDG6922771.1 amidohydrolase [Nitrososphaerota archaeon]
MKRLEREGKNITIRKGREGQVLLYNRRDNTVINPLDPKHYDMEKRIRDLDKYGIDVQVLSVPVPGADLFGKELSRKLAKDANDGLFQIVEKHSERAVALATLPMVDPLAAREELRRAVQELGFKGAIIFSNVNGKGLDSKEFYPVYELAQSLSIPLYVHPTVPVFQNAIGSEYGLSGTFGWPFETTLAIGRLILGGVLDRYPKLNFAFAHGGGMFPFFKGRLVLCCSQYYEMGIFPDLSRPIEEYAKRIYLDTALYHTPAIQCLTSFPGISNLLFATDYPFGPKGGQTFLKLGVSSIEALHASKEEISLICEGNARRLLGIR